MTTIQNKTYIHVWKDKEGDSFIQEQEPSTDIDTAIDEYWEQLLGSLKYSHTLVLNLQGRVFDMIDIETEIENRKEEEQKEFLSDRKFGSYEEQVREEFNLTRGISHA